VRERDPAITRVVTVVTDPPPPPPPPLLDRIASAVVGSSSPPLVLGPINLYQPVSTCRNRYHQRIRSIYRCLAIPGDNYWCRFEFMNSGVQFALDLIYPAHNMADVWP